MIEATTQPRLCQVRSQTDLPCGRPAVATILGVRFCERCAREQEDYFAVGELTQVPRGKSGVTEGGGYAARAPRSGYPAGPPGRRRGPAARNVKTFLLLVVVSVLLLALSACEGNSQARGGAAGSAPEAKVERETTVQERARSAEATAKGNGTHGALARVGDADGAVARAGGTIARADNAQARAGDAARKEGNEAPEGNAAAEERPREDRLRESPPQELTLKVGGDPGTEFSGVCSLGKEERTIGGRVPERYVFELGDAGLECEIRKEDRGALEVVVAGEGGRSLQRSGGAEEGTVRFDFSGGGITSSTFSITLNQIAAASDRASSNDPR